MAYRGTDACPFSVLACSWMFALSGGVLFCRCLLHRLYVRRLTSFQSLRPNIEGECFINCIAFWLISSKKKKNATVVLSPSSIIARTVQAVADVPTGLASLWSSIIGLPESSVFAGRRSHSA